MSERMTAKEIIAALLGNSRSMAVIADCKQRNEKVALDATQEIHNLRESGIIVVEPEPEFQAGIRGPGEYKTRQQLVDECEADLKRIEARAADERAIKDRLTNARRK